MKLQAAFFVPGKPIAQPRPTFARHGPFVQAYVPKEHAVHGWRAKIAEMAEAETRKLKVPWKGPLGLRLVFSFPRPKSHYIKSGLHSRAPIHHTQKPDLDNLEKAVKDAINKIIWNDDSQVVDAHIRKEWCEPGAEGVDVVVWRDIVTSV